MHNQYTSNRETKPGRKRGPDPRDDPYFKNWDVGDGRRCSNCSQPVKYNRRKQKRYCPGCGKSGQFKCKCGLERQVIGSICEDCSKQDCDCGQPKQRLGRVGFLYSKSIYPPACERCMRLDGLDFSFQRADSKPSGWNTEQEIISTLRTIGRSHWTTIRNEMPWLDERSLYRCMIPLLESGRVQRFNVEAPDEISPGGSEEFAEFDLVELTSPKPGAVTPGN